MPQSSIPDLGRAPNIHGVDPQSLVHHSSETKKHSALARIVDDTDSAAQSERLRIIKYNSKLSSMAFPRLKELNVGHSYDIRTSLELISRCPGLTTCHWDAGPSYKPLAPALVQRITSKTWPNLHSFHAQLPLVSEDDLVSILSGMQQIARLDVRCSSAIKPRTMDLLQQHFSTLTVLTLRLNNESTSSPLAQEILSSCHLLEHLSVSRIDATVVAEGKLWVCSKLKVLVLHFEFDPLTISDIQPRVFEQIARLYRLDSLTLWGSTTGYGRRWECFQKTVDLRLENGLGKLSTLRSLRDFRFTYSRQRMGEKEIEWILEHWKSLEEIYGKFNMMKPWVESVDIQPRVFERISRHHRLEHLKLWDRKANVNRKVARFQTTVDLRLENGLAKLSTLRTPLRD
ncbi:MAG: hypothetical protein J3Q66DRAFT_443717 [Benniella sp.]|nr:MAG: hypothetical protein J3Q66DRAFT_443717 [Benniella sp.]